MATCPVPPASSYLPTSLVTTFNGVPHIDIDLDTVPDQFSLSLEYFETIIIWACVPILAVICLFILMTIYFICVCCCCCCQQHSKRSKGSKAACGVLVILIVVFSLALVGVGLWAEFEVNQNIGQFVNSGRDANNILLGIKNSTDRYNSSALDASLMSLRDGINQPIVGQDAREAVEGMIVENRIIEEAFADFDSQTSSFIDLSGPLDVTEFVELIRHWVVIAYLIVTALMLFIVALAICCGACCKSPICPVIALVFFSLFTITMWVAVGANLAFLIVSADICVDPDTLLRNVTASTGEVPPELIDYYLVCNESCIQSPLNSSIVNSTRAFAIIAGQEETVQEYIANDSSRDNLQPLLNTVVLQFDNAEGAVNNISELSQCTGLNEAYLGALSSFCDDAYLYNLILFSMACGLAVFMLIVVLCGCFFAGLLSSGKEYDDETVVYDFPNDGSSPWDSYGTHQHYNTSSQQQYTQFQESYSLRTSPPPNEPPKYNELTARETELSVPTAINGGRPNSGQYDHFEP